MSSGDKMTIGVLFVVGTGLSAWAVLALFTGMGNLVEWIKLACGLLCFVGGLGMLAWPTLREKLAPERETEPAAVRSAPKAAHVSAQPVEGVEGYRVEYKILRRSYVTLAAAILGTAVAVLMIFFYFGNGLNNLGGPEQSNAFIGGISDGFKFGVIGMSLAAAAFWAGYMAPVKGLVLVGAILSVLCVFSALGLGILAVPVAVLGFVGYARTGKPLAKYVPTEEK